MSHHAAVVSGGTCWLLAFVAFGCMFMMEAARSHGRFSFRGEASNWTMHTSMCIHMNIYIYIYISININVYTYLSVYVYIYIHTRLLTFFALAS